MSVHLCAWCNHWFDDNGHIEAPAEPPNIDGFISHSICLVCTDKMRRDLESRPAKLNITADFGRMMVHKGGSGAGT